MTDAFACGGMAAQEFDAVVQPDCRQILRPVVMTLELVQRGNQRLRIVD